MASNPDPSASEQSPATAAGPQIGLIGCGKQAVKHISGLVSAGATPVLADIDADLATAMAADHGLEAVDSPDALFARADIAGIDICTPTPTHRDLIVRSLEAGKPFFVEKPLCSSREEAAEIAALSTQTGIDGMVGYIYRFAPAFEQAKALLDAAALGTITTATFRIGGRGNHQAWKHLKDAGGGAINEMLVHMLDLVVWYFGAIESVDVLRSGRVLDERTIGGEVHEVDAEDWVLVAVTPAAGPEIIIQADMLSRSFVQYVDVQGTAGSFFGSIIPSMTSFVQLDEAEAGFAAGRSELAIEGSNLYGTQMAQFVDLANGTGAGVRHSVADSVMVMDALELIKGKLEHA